MSPELSLLERLSLLSKPFMAIIKCFKDRQTAQDLKNVSTLMYKRSLSIVFRCFLLLNYKKKKSVEL